jgi:glucose-6-phosphate 1-epimerase
MQIIEHPLAGPALRLSHGADEVLVARLGAHVVSWKHNGREMLWCSATRLPGKALRGGIPVCWPWFGAHPTDASQPAHGIARQSSWDVIEHTAQSAALRLEHGNLEARLDVSLGAELKVSLRTHSAGTTTVPLSAALHTYLAVDDIGQVRIADLDGAAYIDTLDGWQRKTQHGDVVFDREVDRIYAASHAMLHDGARSIHVDGAGTSRSLVVWNPWVDKSARLGDMADGAYRRMVCLETAWAGDDARRLAPGATDTLTTVLRPLATSR